MALGAVEAVYEANKEDDIRVYGVDGDMNMLYSVRNGRAAGTVYHDAIGQAEVTIDNVEEYIEVMEKYG